MPFHRLAPGPHWASTGGADGIVASGVARKIKYLPISKLMVYVTGTPDNLPTSVGVLRYSSNFGLTWADATPPAGTDGCLDVIETSGGTIWALFYDSTTPGSPDGYTAKAASGTNINALTVRKTYTAGNQAFNIASSGSLKVAFVGSNGTTYELVVSTDGGTTWTTKDIGYTADGDTDTPLIAWKKDRLLLYLTGTLVVVVIDGSGYFDAPNDSTVSDHPNTGQSSQFPFIVSTGAEPTVYVLAAIVDGGVAPTISVTLGLTWSLQATVVGGTSTLYVWTARVDDPSIAGLDNNIQVDYSSGVHLQIVVIPMVFPALVVSPYPHFVQTATSASPVEATLPSMVQASDVVLSIAGIYFVEWANRGAWSTNTPTISVPANWVFDNEFYANVDGVVGVTEHSVGITVMSNYLEPAGIGFPAQQVFDPLSLHPAWTITDPDGFTTISELTSVTIEFDPTP